MARKREQEYGARVEGMVKGLMHLDHILSNSWSGSVDLTSIKMKLPSDERTETLIILLGTDGEGTPVVAFHSGLGAAEALAGALTRMANGKLKWRIDEYATQ